MFEELLFSKGSELFEYCEALVLVRGDIMGYLVSPDEAYFLMNQSFRFYLDPTLYSQFI